MVEIVRDFLGVLVLSIWGVILIILRRRGIGNPNIIDSLELLILIMVPVSASVALFAEPKTLLYWWLAVYFVGVLLWFIMGVAVISREEDDRTRRQSDRLHSILLGAFIYGGVVFYWLFLNVIPLFAQQTKG